MIGQGIAWTHTIVDNPRLNISIKRFEHMVVQISAPEAAGIASMDHI